MKKIAIKHITILSLVLHILAAIFSTGFQHFDEYFQIYEFLNYKLGITPASDLPWEFREMIRPWFQVFTYFGMYKGASALGVTSPFTFAFIFRIFTSLFGLFALTKLIPLIKEWFSDEKIQKIAWALLNLSWFVPYIQTRTNSESFSISFFIMGLAYFLKPSFKGPSSHTTLLKNTFFAGILFGLSYLSRSQMAFCVAFLWFWAVFIGKYKKSYLSLSAIAIIIMVLSGILFDKWGYGEWTFSTWHYFRTNFLEGIMSTVKQYPFWWYFRLALNRGIPPVSLPLILATVWAWWRFKKHPLTWATLPLFAFHSYVGHKELRYIFPIIILSPIFMAFFIDTYKERLTILWNRRSFKAVTYFVLTINFLFLLIGTFRPANPSVNFYKYIYSSDHIKSIKSDVESPYTMLGLNMNYYKKKGFKVEKISDHKKFLAKGSDSYLFFNKGHHILAMENEPNCKSVYMAYPRWTLDYNIGNWLSRSRVWSLYYCN